MGGKGYAWYSSVGGRGWVCREKNSLSLDMAAAAIRRDTSRQREEEKKLLWLPRSALPCPGQPSSGCEAGRPLELSLEGSLSPRHRVLPGGGARRSDWAPEVSRTDLTALPLTITFSHSDILILPPASQPTNQPSFDHRPPLGASPTLADRQTDTHAHAHAFARQDSLVSHCSDRKHLSCPQPPLAPS